MKLSWTNPRRSEALERPAFMIDDEDILGRTKRRRRRVAEAGGLLLGVVFLVVLAALSWPLRFDRPVNGEIVKFIWYGKGASLSAQVRTIDGEFLVPVFQSDNCRIGGRIYLVASDTLLGRRYAAAPVPCLARTQEQRPIRPTGELSDLRLSLDCALLPGAAPAGGHPLRC